MIRINKKLALAASLAAVVVGLGTAGVAFAAGDNDDNINPAGAAFNAANSTNITFKGNVNGIPVTVTCKNSNIAGVTPAAGLGPVNINNPTFANCTDNLGGADTIATNNVNGAWRLTFIDLANDEGIVIGNTADEPPGHPGHVGDSLQITIPKAGATFRSTVLPGCVITAAPAGPANITGAYDDVNTLTFNGANIPVAGAGCAAANSAISGSYKSNIVIQDVS